jgi:hypothetical protein
MAKPEKTPTPARRSFGRTAQNAAKPSRVALRVGDGQALVFLPDGIHPVVRPKQRLFQRVKKFFSA